MKIIQNNLPQVGEFSLLLSNDSELDLPSGYRLPKRVTVGHTDLIFQEGVPVGRRWFLLSANAQPEPREIYQVSTPYFDNESLELLQKFLLDHQYVCIDLPCGVYELQSKQ